MIKYFCDNCKNELKQGDLYDVCFYAESDVYKSNSNKVCLCLECRNKMVDDLKELFGGYGADDIYEDQ